MRTKVTTLFFGVYAIFILLVGMTACGESQVKTDPIDKKVEEILNGMTLRQKVGQLNQLKHAKLIANNHKETDVNIDSAVINGDVGTFLNVWWMKDKRHYQKLAMEHTGIPLIFALDIIHGFRTTFPVPLGEAASWNLPLIERSARIMAIEGTSSGNMWTFAPMVDISFDARWGRMMEGAGEDPYLGSQIAAARVHGFQGDDLSANNTMLACAKHFAAYGQVEAGRDYNQTTVSERFLREYVLPPFHAAEKAGCRTFMNAFNDYDGVPCSGNKFLIRDILKGEWGFKGAVVSDYNSFEEMVDWRYAKDRKEAALKAIEAGSDIDMMGLVYMDHLQDLVEEGKVDVALIDDAVRRVLKLKFELGLFDDPFKYFTEGLQEKEWRRPEYVEHARKIARESMVLLKNDEQLLPLSKTKYKKIAVIGPIDAKPETHMGTWSAAGPKEEVVRFTEGIKNKVGKAATVTFEAGCADEHTADSKALARAIRLAKSSDFVILTLGEGQWFSGENTSLVDISLPKPQVELAKKIKALNKPTVVVMADGRPICMPWIKDNMPTILESWLAGCEAGNALADVLFGDYNPSGKLPVTFPAHTGQVPISYLKKATGRPTENGTRYLDASNDPAYPFGFGLSYTHFKYSNLKISTDSLKLGQSLQVSVDLENTGQYDGKEVVQLYISDLYGSTSRPLKELKHFELIELKKGERKTVHFTITEEDLKMWNEQMEFVAEPGEFQVQVGTNSDEVITKNFILS
ncbi:beta-glucosidase BglX [Persicobacter psychrovividus]|uniref:Glycosyl hydrolase n=1 Tax=Persicobacter psychrovividus TaxID=387638 RepID=A0ABM7VJU9_9BACT|nr:glycosyl hydrolase [Persicobacter psychrovividus]